MEASCTTDKNGRVVSNTQKDDTVLVSMGLRAAAVSRIMSERSSKEETVGIFTWTSKRCRLLLGFGSEASIRCRVSSMLDLLSDAVKTYILCNVGRTYALDNG